MPLALVSTSKFLVVEHVDVLLHDCSRLLPLRQEQLYFLKKISKVTQLFPTPASLKLVAVDILNPLGTTKKEKRFWLVNNNQFFKLVKTVFFPNVVT